MACPSCMVGWDETLNWQDIQGRSPMPQAVPRKTEMENYKNQKDEEKKAEKEEMIEKGKEMRTKPSSLGAPHHLPPLEGHTVRPSEFVQSEER